MMSLENGCALFVGMMCLLIAGYYFFSRKPITIYNQSQPPRIEDLKDVRKYNRATALLMAIYGLIFVLEGILIKNSLVCLVTMILTVMPGIVVVCAVYEMIILKKYLK